MASTTRPNVRAIPTWVMPPPLTSLMTMAPVPENTRANVPINSAMKDFMLNAYANPYAFCPCFYICQCVYVSDARPCFISRRLIGPNTAAAVEPDEGQGNLRL